MLEKEKKRKLRDEIVKAEKTGILSLETTVKKYRNSSEDVYDAVSDILWERHDYWEAREDVDYETFYWFLIDAVF